MPKATAVWLVDNTALTFEQIADFCGLHPLEVKGIADEDVAKGIKGQDPVATGQLTREQIAEAEKDPEDAPEDGARPSTRCRDASLKKRAALHAGLQAPGQARCGLLDHPQPSRIRRRRHHQADRHHQGDHREDPRALALERRQHQGGGSGDAGPVLAAGTRPGGDARDAKRERAQKRAAKKGATLKPLRDAVPGARRSREFLRRTGRRRQPSPSGPASAGLAEIADCGWRGRSPAMSRNCSSMPAFRTS